MSRPTPPALIDDDLDGKVNARISRQAEDLLEKFARERAIKPSTAARILIYRGLGLIRAEPRVPARAKAGRTS